MSYGTTECQSSNKHFKVSLKPIKQIQIWPFDNKLLGPDSGLQFEEELKMLGLIDSLNLIRN